MAKPIYIPRVNNNDDSVQVVAINVERGQQVGVGEHVADVETDKSVFEVSSESEGYILDIKYDVDDHAVVGSVFMWLGESADEPIPETVSDSGVGVENESSGRPTARALALLRRYGLTADQVPSVAERLSASDVEAFAVRRGLVSVGKHKSLSQERVPDTAGQLEPLSAEELGMFNTVTWHRDYAAAAYLEIEYDSAIWEQTASEYANQHRLLMSPLLPLMAYRLVQLVNDRPKFNSTMVGAQRYRYAQVNLGFTVQAGETLYLTVTRNAGSMSVPDFLKTLGEIQRSAMSHKIAAESTQGATVSFTSMSRWKVVRHIPILPPHTSLIVAHAATDSNGKSVLGASYDHRVLSGFDVVKLLRDLAKPPQV